LLLPISSRRCFVSRLPVGQECREHGGANHFTQRGLRDTLDGLPVVGDLQCRLARVMDVPENDRVDIDRHGILGQCLLGIESGGLDALIDGGHHIVDDREDHKASGGGCWTAVLLGVFLK
jgi:hypothetical protein